MPVSTRRDFLTTTTLAVAGTVLRARHLTAGVPLQIPLNSRLTTTAFLSDTLLPQDLRTLSTQAVDAAMAAGASYADVRVAVRHSLDASWTRVVLLTHGTFGVRALVDGVWGFAYGQTLTPDAIAACAQRAVSAGRVSARLAGAETAGRLDATWAPAPLVTGEWQTPMAIDPFTVPVQQHAEAQLALIDATRRVPEADTVSVNTQWTQETRVFAASTGSLITQHFRRAMTTGIIQTHYGRDPVVGRVPSMHCTSAGYEVMTAPDLAEHFKEAAEEAASFARLPMRPLEVGRYPVIFDGYVMGNLLLTIVGPSLEFDRSLSTDAGASGMSLFTPGLLGNMIASPAVTITGSRTLPSITAVRWDDEGNVPKVHTVIRDGVFMDYHTGSQTIPVLDTWYQQHGMPLGSNGCAVAGEAEHTVLIRPPHLTMTPSAMPMSRAGLCKEMRRGIIVIHDGWIRSDHQFTSGSIVSNGGGGLYEVSRGQIVRRLFDMGLQFNTRPFLKAIAAVGDTTTVRQQDLSLTKGSAWNETHQSATAPAVLFKEANVVSTHAV